jgi:hypothetical protein
MAMLSPALADGWFSFEPLVNNALAFLILSDMNAPRIAAGPLTNKDRFQAKGVTHISEHPWKDIQSAWFNPMFSFVIPQESKFQVVFSLLPDGAVAPFPAAGQYAIGSGTKRVDFAGFLIAGQILSDQKYNEIAGGVAKAPGI